MNTAVVNKILVVDDDANFLKLVAMRLERIVRTREGSVHRRNAVK